MTHWNRLANARDPSDERVVENVNNCFNVPDIHTANTNREIIVPISLKRGECELE